MSGPGQVALDVLLVLRQEQDDARSLLRGGRLELDGGASHGAREIASRTEQYWCPIKFRLDPPAPHARYRQFLPYGDGAEVKARMSALRRSLQREASDEAGPEN